jgi:hypothetical protein
MKRLLIPALVAILFSCNDEEQLKIHNFSGTVSVPQFNGSDPVPLANAKLKIHFYTGEALPLIKLVESAELSTDTDGKYTLQKKLPENKYTMYSVEVDEPYYRDCTGITSPTDAIEYHGFSAESNYENEMLICYTAEVKIVATKTNAGSNTSVAISNKATAGNTSVLDGSEVVSSNTEKTYIFFSRVTEVEFTLKRYSGTTLTGEEKVVVNPQVELPFS